MPKTFVAQVGSVASAVSTEATVLTTPSINVNAPGSQGVEISGAVNVTMGTSAVQATVRVRAGVGTGGANLGPAAGFIVTAAAGTQVAVPFSVLDPTTVGNNLQYTLTYQQNSGSVAGTILAATIGAQPVTSAF